MLTENIQDDAVTMLAMHGDFYGAVHKAARIEGLIAAHVPRKQIAEVAECYQTKWWDYRRMAPGHSFTLFAHHYYRAFKIGAKRAMRERATPQHKVALQGLGRVQYEAADIFQRDQRHITGMWKAMLVCDSFGIPYDTFCQLAMSVAIETKWRQLPNPAHLYSEKLAALLLDKWEDVQRERQLSAKHPIYKVENYAGLKVQNDYREWIVAHLKQQKNVASALAVVMIDKGQLTEAQATAAFSAQAVKQAKLMR